MIIFFDIFICFDLCFWNIYLWHYCIVSKGHEDDYLEQQRHLKFHFFVFVETTKTTGISERIVTFIWYFLTQGFILLYV